MCLPYQGTAPGSYKFDLRADPEGSLGLLLNVVVHPADIQNRDGALHLLRRGRFAGGGYAGRKMAMTVWRTGAWSLQIVKRLGAAGFEALPKQWIVEPNRRLARASRSCCLKRST